MPPGANATRTSTAEKAAAETPGASASQAKATPAATAGHGMVGRTRAVLQQRVAELFNMVRAIRFCRP